MEGESSSKRTGLEQPSEDVDGGVRNERSNLTLTYANVASLGILACGRMKVGHGLELNVQPSLGLAQVGIPGEMESSSGGGGQESLSSTGGHVGDASLNPSPDAEEWIHPLLIPHVLDIVFTHILQQCQQPKDIQSIRLVCHTWKERATNLYRQARSPTYFGHLCEDEDTIYRSESIAKMMRLVDAMKSSDLIPVQSYVFQDTYFCSAQGNRIMKDFLRICGPQAVSFDFAVHEFAAEYLNLRDLQLDQLRTLKVRLIDLGWVEHRGDTYGLEYFIGSLLDGAKSLREFELKSNFGLCMYQFENVILPRIPTTLKVLSLNMFLSQITLNYLLENEFKLEELVIHSNCASDLEEGTLQKFWKDQAPSLKSLQILSPFCGDLNSWAVPLELPRLSNLTSLELSGPNVQPFSIVDNLPKLSFLDVQNWTPEGTLPVLFEYAKKTAPSVRKIRMPWSISNAPFISQVKRCFPNLKELHLCLSKDTKQTLQGVFTELQSLEILDIEFYTHGDHADTMLSGIARDDWERMLRLPGYPDVNEEGLERKPSLLNLTNLKKLAIRGGGCYSIVTEFAVHFVFLRMANLKSLYLANWEICRREYIDRLREKLFLTLGNENWRDFHLRRRKAMEEL